MNEVSDTKTVTERPETFWRRVYLAIVIVTFIVVTLLWLFSKYFS